MHDHRWLCLMSTCGRLEYWSLMWERHTFWSRGRGVSLCTLAVVPDPCDIALEVSANGKDTSSTVGETTKHTTTRKMITPPAEIFGHATTPKIFRQAAENVEPMMDRSCPWLLFLVCQESSLLRLLVSNCSQNAIVSA